jgi:hypothetical protein
VQAVTHNERVLDLALLVVVVKARQKRKYNVRWWGSGGAIDSNRMRSAFTGDSKYIGHFEVFDFFHWGSTRR